jgi:hypothetical protein
LLRENSKRVIAKNRHSCELSESNRDLHLHKVTANGLMVGQK